MLGDAEKELVRDALAMDEAQRRRNIDGCFTWSLTPKGHRWWKNYYVNHPSGPTDAEACAELRAMLDETERPKRRPQIGEPGFEWQIGMWCRTRGGDVVQVSRIRMVSPPVTYPIVTDSRYYTSNGQYYEGGADPNDLVKVVAWPKEQRT